MSAAVFHQVCQDVAVGHLPELVKNDGVAQYSSMGYMDFVKGYFAAKLDGVAQYSSMGLWEELPRESEELWPLWNVGLRNTIIGKT